jgi:hypothetical protein
MGGTAAWSGIGACGGGKPACRLVRTTRPDDIAGPKARNIVRDDALPGPSVLALLTVSTGLAILILGAVWFVFFRT